MRAPAQRRRLRLDLLHRGPDVIEELHLRTRPQPACALPDRAADDVRLRERCVVAASDAKLGLEPEGDAEHAALARHLPQHAWVGVGDVFAEHTDARVARHLLVEREADRLAERNRHDFFLPFGTVPFGPVGGIGRQVGDRTRTDEVVRDALRVGAGRGQGVLGGGGHELVRFGPDFLRAFGRQHSEPDELVLEEQDRIVFGFVLQLLGDAVLLLVVGQRVRVRTRHCCVYESRALSGAHALDRLGAARSHLEVVAPVEHGYVQAPDAHHHLRHRRRGLVACPHRDGVPVVCDHVEDGQAEPARGVQALPELALGARAFAERHVRDLVAVRAAAGKVAADDVAACLGATDGRQALAARRARLAHDVARRIAPVARHLATA